MIWIAVLFGLIFAVGVVAIVLAERQNLAQGRRGFGVEPGPGNTILTVNLQGNRGFHTHAWQVTRDPQAYAKIFAPGRRNKD